MQYIYRTLYIVFTILLLASCASNDEILGMQEQVDVSFVAKLPKDLQTRSYGDGMKVNILYVGVFNSSGIEIMRKTSPIVGGTIDFSISLTKDQSYNIVFWAQNSDCDIYNITDLKSIKMNTYTIVADFETVEKMDVFYATCKEINIAGPSIYTVDLVRPLAQINIGTSGQAVANSKFKIIGAPTSFNPFTQEVSGIENISFTYNAIPNKTFTVEGVDYNYLAMGYLFASKDTQIFDCELELNEADGTETVKYNIPEVHFQSNKRTNIIGSLTGD